MSDTDTRMDILNFTIATVDGVPTETELGDDLAIDPGDINQSFIDQPGKFAWWAVMAAKARAKADRLKVAAEKQDDFIRKTLVGTLDSKVRQELELDGEKITESKVTSGIYKHADYIAAVDEYNKLREQWVQANEDASVLEAARDAMYQRKDMLISLGANMRMDMSNVELSMKKQQVADTIRAGRSGRKPITAADAAESE